MRLTLDEAERRGICRHCGGVRGEHADDCARHGRPTLASVPPALKRAPDPSCSEAELQARVQQVAEALGWEHYHTHDSRRSPSGFPDLVLWSPARRRVMLRELKAERGRLTAAQRAVLDSQRRAGADVGVWRPRDWGRILVELA